MERNGRSAVPCARAQRIRSRTVMLWTCGSAPSAQHGNTARRRQYHAAVLRVGRCSACEQKWRTSG
eukprot:5584366-Prymnesium_polylepis.1